MCSCGTKNKTKSWHAEISYFRIQTILSLYRHDDRLVQGREQREPATCYGGLSAGGCEHFMFNVSKAEMLEFGAFFPGDRDIPCFPGDRDILCFPV